MNWSFRVGRVFGIPIRIHATFLILLGIFFFSEARHLGARSGVRSLAFMLLLFTCVLLHELGHCVVAMRFGVTIHSITLYPFGGIATLVEIPREPAKEILIAVAGPLVNFTLAIGLFGIVALLAPAEHLGLVPLTGTDLVRSLFSANLLLGLFNMIPAYPMDGGRILRGILACRIDYHRATQVAANIGKMFGILFVAVGVFVDWWLAVIGVFLYMGATSEEQSTLLQSTLDDLRVRDLMITDFQTVSPAETLQDVLGRSFHSFQDDFPVVRGDAFLGVLTRARILEAMRQEGREQSVQAILEPVKERASPSDRLRDVMRRMHARGVTLLPVMEEERLVGIVTLGGILRGAVLLARNPERG
ncbi:MAG TPA: site-2 protease family protein [Candidatus Polarisedimenticolia bacterium]|nr:site-2 protease family protein [Candidatus Polarisedimenticolia bacterium]